MLETKRCKLSNLKQSDYYDILKLYKDDRVRQYLGGTVSEDKFKLKYMDIMKSNETSKYWVVREKTGCQFIGIISLTLHHDGKDTEVSYQLMPKWWRQGYGTEVVGEIIQYAFKNLELPRLLAETQTANTPSRKLLEKLGMKLERTAIRFGEEQSIYSIENNIRKQN